VPFLQVLPKVAPELQPVPAARLLPEGHAQALHEVNCVLVEAQKLHWPAAVAPNGGRSSV